MMDWNKLLSAKRWGYETRGLPDADSARSEFQRDYDRLIFSSPFRRLQNKTQVFPLPGSVFVHNRLTHSLEVASVGRSLGRLFYQDFCARNPDADRKIPSLQQIGDIVSAACLSHDLGNPAFGHSGEAAISNYFISGEGQAYQNDLSATQWADLINFEGNANALRILTHGFSGKDPKGFALTYATLGSILKYPCSSTAGHKKNQAHLKKYGFFDSERGTFNQIAQELGLLPDPNQEQAYFRHPLVYLVEAADDICYNIVDLEDAHRLGILRYEEISDLLLPLCRDAKLPQRLDQLDDVDSKVSLLRAKAINTLIISCANAFSEYQEQILNGQFKATLMDVIEPDLVAAQKRISTLSYERIYNAHSVIQIEVAGYKVMGGLLEEFVPAYLNNHRSPLDKKLLSLIPKQFYTSSEDTYSKIRSVLDFVSGMTDLYAVELFRKIKGISFPSLD